MKDAHRNASHCKSAGKFTSLDLIQVDNDQNVFEVVLGRQDGSIWHGCFNGTAGAAIDEYDALTMVIPGEALGYKPVIDIKIIQREQKEAQPVAESCPGQNQVLPVRRAQQEVLTTVFAVTHSNLYQFNGTGPIKNNF